MRFIYLADTSFDLMILKLYNIIKLFIKNNTIWNN